MSKAASHPSRVRELKRMPQRRFVGNHPSHPSRVRELKLALMYGCLHPMKSHPSRVRELKHREGVPQS